MEDQQVILSAKSMSKLKIRVPPDADEMSFWNADTTQDAYGGENSRLAGILRQRHGRQKSTPPILHKARNFRVRGRYKKATTQNANAQKPNHIHIEIW